MQIFALIVASLIVACAGALAQPFVPTKPDLTGVVANPEKLAALGKALFFDEQVGSDGMACATCHFHAGADVRKTNVLSPGFKDLSVPGGDIDFGSDRSDTGVVKIGSLISGYLSGANVALSAADFPFHKLVNPFDGQSAIVSTTNDVASSPGVVKMDFEKVAKRGRRTDDRCSDPDAGLFGVDGHRGKRLAVRQTEPRNTPTVINAALFQRTFWDVRANEEFNGIDVFGPRTIKADPSKRLFVLQPDGTLAPGFVSLRKSSLASLSVGPPLSNLEMSCDQRTFADVGRKLLNRRPLALQRVHREDSLLAGLRARNGYGLRDGYDELVREVFEPRWWSAEGRYYIDPDGTLVTRERDGYTQAEANFSLFFGVAVQAYLQTLISDQSEFDELRAAGRILTFDINQTDTALCYSPAGDVDPLLLKGCTVFAGLGGCTACHNENQQQGQAGQNRMPMLAVGAVREGQPFNLVIGGGRRSTPEGGGAAPRIHRDQGVAGTGVTPFFQDLLAGGEDPYGTPLSYMRQFRRYALAVQGGATQAEALDTHVIDTILREEILAGKVFAGVVPTGALGVDSAPKAPTMRNVMLTPPYFHNGGAATIRQVLEFYNRGSDLRSITAGNAAVEASVAGKACVAGDTSGTGPMGDSTFPLEGVTDCGSNTGAGVKELGLVDCNDPRFAERCVVEGLTAETDDLGAMIRFFASLTDPRVQRNAAPFDGPEQHVNNGHKLRDRDDNGVADEIVVTIPATGASGFSDGSPCVIPNAGDLFAAGVQGRLSGECGRDRRDDDDDHKFADRD